MTLQRIEGMPDLETDRLRTLPERLMAAQQAGNVSDGLLCQLLDWTADDLDLLKAGERRPTPGEMRALYGCSAATRTAPFVPSGTAAKGRR